MIAKTVTAPLERMKMLAQTGEHGLSMTKKSNKSKSISMTQMYQSVLRHEGVRGLWAGNGANLLRIFPAKGVVFASNDCYRSWLARVFGLEDSSDGSLPVHLGFVAGGMSGISASAVTYPLDFVRGRISGKIKGPSSSSSSSSVQYRGIVQTMIVTVRYEGFLALYKGITPTLIGAIPYEGIKFGTVALCENLVPLSSDMGDDDWKTQKIYRKVLFGGLGGVMAGLITYPNDTVRRMLQLQGSHGTTEVYAGYFDCVRQTVSKFGVRRLYSGVGINLIRMAPNTAVQFGSYEFLKRISEDIMYS